MPKALTWVLTTYGEPRLSQRIAGLALVVPIMITTAIRELKKKKMVYYSQVLEGTGMPSHTVRQLGGGGN